MAHPGANAGAGPQGLWAGPEGLWAGPRGLDSRSPWPCHKSPWPCPQSLWPCPQSLWHWPKSEPSWLGFELTWPKDIAVYMIHRCIFRFSENVEELLFFPCCSARFEGVLCHDHAPARFRLRGAPLVINLNITAPILRLLVLHPPLFFSNLRTVFFKLCPVCFNLLQNAPIFWAN